MGEIVGSGAIEFPLQMVISTVCSVAIRIYALLQSEEGSDDDDSGSGGGGGLMQPVAMGSR